MRQTLIFPCLVFQFEEGGPIIAVQVENEYGSYAKDEKYMPFIKNVSLLMYCNVSFSLIIHCNVANSKQKNIFLQCLESRGIKELLLTSDNWEGLRCGGMEGGNEDNYNQLPNIVGYVMYCVIV